MSKLNLLFLLLLQQSVVTLPASVEGIVLDSETRQPLAGATMTVQDRGSSGSSMVAITSNDGVFTLRSIPPGQYTIEASRAGYVTEMIGTPSTDPRNFTPDPLTPRLVSVIQDLRAGEALSNLRIVLTPGGAITGRLTTERGELVAGAVVQAHKTTHKDGMRERTTVQSVVSNDRGEYRLFGLKPGTYTVSLIPPKVVVPNVTGQSFSIPLFYPGTVDPQASTTMNLRAGQEIQTVNFTAIPSRNRRISGGVQGNGIEGVNLMLSPLNGTATLRTTIFKGTPNPSFQFSDIVPGTYTLVAQTQDMRTALSLDVRNTDVLGTRILIGPGFKIPVRVRIDGGPAGDNPALENIYLKLRPDIPIPGLEAELYSPFANGRFTLEALQGKYWIEITRTEDYYVKAITLGGIDVLNQGLNVPATADTLEVVLDTHFGEILGSASTPNATVVLVPDAPRRNQRPLYKAMKSANGPFRFEKVPPGDYKLFAWSETTIDNGGPWLDLDYLRAYEDRATPIRVQSDMRTILDRPIPSF